MSLETFGEFQKCAGATWEGNDFVCLKFHSPCGNSGSFRKLEESEAILEELKLPNGTDVTGGYNNGETFEILVGTLVKIRIPREPSVAVAKDLNHLLSIGSTCAEAPNEYFLWERPFYFQRGSSLQTAPDQIRWYHQALDLVQMLTRQADDENGNTLLFFHLRKLEMKLTFRAEDLLGAIAILEIQEFLTSTALSPKLQRQIFASVLVQMLKDTKPENALGILLRSSDVFSRQLNEAVAIFLAENSPEKLAAEANRRRLELAEKIEKLITSLEAKSLSIPVAVVLAAKEIKPGANTSRLNEIIIWSCVLFFLTMLFLCFTQNEVFLLAKTEIEKAQEDFKRKGLSENDPFFKKNLPSLLRRVRGAQIAVWGVCVLSLIPIGTCFWMLH